MSNILLFEINCPLIWSSSSHHLFHFRLLHGHLLLHHLLLHSHRVLSYHNSDSLDKTKHGASNQRILECSLWSWSKSKNTTCHEPTENSIEWVICLPVVEHQAINGTKAATPHCKTTSNQRCSVSDMSYCSDKSLSSWCVPEAYNWLEVKKNLPFKK